MQAVHRRLGWRLFSTRSAADFKRMGVIGSGKMGTGIAAVASRSGMEVLIMDVDTKALQNSVGFIEKLFTRDVEKGRLTSSSKKECLERIQTVNTLEQFKMRSVDFVVEAATENLPLKLSIFQQLSSLLSPDVILATNTSSISITKIAAATTRPDKVIGMHFFQPVPIMKIVEIITGLQTSPETLNTTIDLAKRMNKITTRSKDLPGFIANRVLMPYINEAVLVLQEGTATVEDIDTTMKEGCNVPMGPLRLADFIGLDTCLSILKVLHQGFGDSKYRPAPLLQQYVDAGLTGEKSGRGFYDYSQNQGGIGKKAN